MFYITLKITVIELQSFIEMILKLKDIATVSSGVTFRSRIEASQDGGVRVIQMKDLGDDNVVHLGESIHIDHAKPKPNQLAKLGDIIFRSRGQTNTAALLNKDVKSTIVAAPLLRVRPDVNKVVPEFLLWWINQPLSQSYLVSRSKGTMVKMVSKEGLENLEVNLPSLERQAKVAEFFSLSMREQTLLEGIKNRKAIYTQGILMQIASASRQTASNKTPDFDAATSKRERAMATAHTDRKIANKYKEHKNDE
jgi:restriction endonuclease S subunit